LTTHLHRDTLNPLDCASGANTNETQIWSFTNSCGSMYPPREYNSTFRGCAETCVFPQTLNMETGACDAPSTEIPKKRSPKNGGVCKGNPCDILTGTKIQREIDYAPGTGVLAFARTYNSLPYLLCEPLNAR
jgi:hypothetical protein